MAATLDALVPSIIAHIIMFVFLEKVVGPHLIALFQQTLEGGGKDSRCFYPA